MFSSFERVREATADILYVKSNGIYLMTLIASAACVEAS